MLTSLNPEYSAVETIAELVRSTYGLTAPVVTLDQAGAAQQVEELLGRDVTVAIMDANSAVWDGTKSRLHEVGAIGAHSALSKEPIWIGSTKPPADDLGSTESDRALFINYYTTGTPYEQVAQRLKSSLEQHGLDHQIVGLPHCGSWEENCAQKARFVREMWHKTGRPVVWLDADATVEQAPGLLTRCGADFAIHKWRAPEHPDDGSRFGWEFTSGTVFFGRSAQAEMLLNLWYARCEADPLTWDQVHLDAAWADTSALAPLRTLWLPRRYYQIFDQPGDIDGELPVIRHWQASRALKSEMSAGKTRPKTPTAPAMARARRYGRFSRSPESFFWMSEGTQHIKPHVGLEHPEGFDPAEHLQRFISPGASVLEVGCGVGRIAAGFDPACYRGVDLNPTAVATARHANPNHVFSLITEESEYPAADVVFSYTVLLHVNDTIIWPMLQRLARSARRVILAEIMDRRWRREGNPPVFNREAEEMVAWMNRLGYDLVASDRRPYLRYNNPDWWSARDTRLATLVFDRR